jgi:arylsulfatase A-like enzyme
LTFYDEAVRVPFLIRWPGNIPPGLAVDACLGTTDIMPTILGLMGLPVPEEAEGMDVSLLARGEKGPEPEAALLQGMGHTYLWKDGFEWRGLRDKRYTYAIFRRDRAELFFDNLNDPLQTKNVIGEKGYHEEAVTFRLMLRRKMEELDDTFEKSSWYRDYWTDGKRNIMKGAKG